MPTRKQRRRRQKELRHEYEYVYVDQEGQEVEADADKEDAPQRDARRNGKGDPGRAKAAAAKRPIRKIDPPSWTRVLKRASLLAPLMFITFGFLNHESLAAKLALTLAYTAFLIPFMYLMDRALYRSNLRRSGQQAPRRPARKR